MPLLIADTFTDALARLTAEEQKAVKTTAFDLQTNPESPGLSFHRLDRARDKRFWSVRVSADIRIIVHRDGQSHLLCYVDHHDKAYDWAERRKLEVHPATGAAQLVEIRESVREIEVPQYVPSVAPAPTKEAPRPVLAGVSADDLLGYGVPAEWIPDAQAATEDALLALIDHLPREAAEALLELATGGTPVRPIAQPASADPFAHPDAQRRFRVMANMEELDRALSYPWERWSVFLHPAQREIVERRFSGPARVAGTAGTGKTVVALHRAVHLARANPAARVLLTTFSVTLSRLLAQKLRRLTDGEPELAARIRVGPLDDIALELHEESVGTPKLATRTMLDALLSRFSREAGGLSFADHFVAQEWHEVVDAWQVSSWEEYRDVQRLGRKTRLPEKQRAALWQILTKVRDQLLAGGAATPAMVLNAMTDELQGGHPSPFDFVVVDEAQDVSVQQLRFLAALGGNRPDALFFAGDLGQRIFQTPFSWKSLGVDVRGRSQTLRINYRTSHQIRAQADRLLDPEIGDVDGNTESRRGTISVFDGPEPVVQRYTSVSLEAEGIAEWIRERLQEGYLAEEIGIFIRSSDELDRVREASRLAGLAITAPAPGVDPEAGKIVVMPMHQAKGLEFRAVVVAACDEDVLPFQSRIEEVTEESDLEEVYRTERHLLYVACTRARDRLLVTATGEGSEFLEDFSAGRPQS